MPDTRPSALNRPLDLAVQVRQNQQLARRLREQVNVTLERVAPKYAELVDKAIEMALKGDVPMMRLLVELPFKFLPIEEQDQGKFGKAREKWSLTHEVLLPMTVEVAGGRVVEANGIQAIEGEYVADGTKAESDSEPS